MFLYISYLIFSIYIISLIFFIIGIFNIKDNCNNNSNFDNISIIVCVRNGEKSVLNILKDLKMQNYNGDLEFIIVDDDSNDNTKKIVNNFILDDNRFKYLNTKNYQSDLKHKKKALDYGISISKYDWLLFTDVDCRIKKDWSLEISKNFDNANYIIGFSEVEVNKTIASKFQYIDFKMLMVSALSSVASGFPLACIGQNQAYSKKLFVQNKGFSKIKKLLQGDDSIFMQLCIKNKNCKVSYSAHENSYVLAKTHLNWKDLIIQRIRWAGDANIMWKYNIIFYIIIVATFITNLFFILLLLGTNYYNFFILLFIKYFFEYSLYILSCKKLNHKINNILFQLWFLLQIPYIVIVGVGSFYASNLKWKGR